MFCIIMNLYLMTHHILKINIIYDILFLLLLSQIIKSMLSLDQILTSTASLG